MERKVKLVRESGVEESTTEDNPFEIDWSKDLISITFYLDNVEVGSVYRPTSDEEPEDFQRHADYDFDAENAEAVEPEPSHNDEVLCCPDCGRANQFGEICTECENDRQREIHEKYYGND